MPTDKPRFSITVDQNLSDAIDDYKYRTRAKNQTQAVVELIERGLDSLDLRLVETKKSPAPEGTEDKISVDDMKAMLRGFGFLDANGDLSDDDLKFLSSVFDLLDAWFSR